MRTQKYRWLGVVLVALLASGMVTGCGTSNLLSRIGSIITLNHANDFGQWQQKTEKEARAYEAQRFVVVETLPDGSDQRRRGVVTDLQYAEFNTYEKNVGAAEVEVQKDFDEWSRSGTKPVSFDGHAKTLREQQEKLINLVKAVKP